jgi:hypothetical protein
VVGQIDARERSIVQARTASDNVDNDQRVPAGKPAVMFTICKGGARDDCLFHAINAAHPCTPPTCQEVQCLLILSCSDSIKERFQIIVPLLRWDEQHDTHHRYACVCGLVAPVALPCARGAPGRLA